MKKTVIAAAIYSTLFVSGCSNYSTEMTSAVSAETAYINPLLNVSTLTYQTPMFDKIKDEHFMPAFTLGMAEHLEEVERIASNPATPTFENTLVAMEKSGALLKRTSSVFFNLIGTDSSVKRRQLQKELAPMLAEHRDNINLNAALFGRIKSLYDNRNSLELDSESKRLLDVYYTNFVRAGAKLSAEDKEKIRKINEEHSSLTTQFSQNLLAETSAISVIVDDKAALDGLTERQILATKRAAEAAGHKDKHLIGITNTTRQPILASLTNRALRQQIWQASAYRAQSGDNDNTQIIIRLAQLRAEKAALLGYKSWADYGLEKQMAGNPKAVYDMLGSMVPAVVSNVEKEAADIKTLIQSEGHSFDIKPWDWAYYAEKVRQSRYDLDETEVKKYFEFNNVLENGVFYTMNKLYGVSFKARPDLPVYHPDVKAYELFDNNGESLAIFFADYFAREGKRGGAWMNSFVGQSELLNQKPVVINVMNIAKAPDGEPTFVSYNEVTTMFHEMGHGLHGMFSDVKYPSLAGTAVSRDFVEFPSTFEEDWAAHPEVISNYAKHYQTGEPIPNTLLDKVIRSRTFNMGYDTLEYMASALLDMEWHTISPEHAPTDINEFEQAALEKHGVALDYVPPRYKSAFFAHSMGGGYSAGYYAYMWSEILAADAYAYVQKLGGLKLENGEKYRKHILSVGNSRPVMDSYKAFRGKEPTTAALLKRRGLDPK
ncbi:M3 family metallopeptidase [Pseudoalteromonas sp. SCSIO 43201]|uniref:M3 family metallopeptidase n=1 Tax=Pseudoalteromonas sp. SCSIO 43201 TaxID=2822842 RepID=UPI002075BC0D|nr:M3 family metallopeptidase [Pseudoalteromonas sp. SCSIO 43201]USD29281.1 M3 family metallopeptidase [Pseudoalteromonas sp. SCSIO 43201]